MKQLIIAWMLSLLSFVHGTELETNSANRIETLNDHAEHEAYSLHGLNDHRNHSFQMIPEEAIRLRILANSNRDEDQQLKLHVRDAVYTYIHEQVQNLRHIDDARYVVAQSLSNITTIVEQVMNDEGVIEPFHVTYNEQVPFPEKRYGPYVYPEGLYEAIVITLGSGQGDNWWCVLFPPLCFVDFFNEVAIHDEGATNDDDPISTSEIEIDEIDESDEETQTMDTDDEQSNEMEVRFFLLDWLNFS